MARKITGTAGYTGYTDVGGNNIIVPSATMMGGGRAASQANQVQSIRASQAASQAAQDSAIANAMALAAQNAAKAATPQVPNLNLTPAPDISRNGSNGGGGSLQAAPAQTDPYAGIYSIYEQQLNAQRDALAQQKQARLNALQANYNNAKSRLDSSFNQGETELNQNADRALREAFIEDMLNRRALNQQLAANGIIGGAAESVLARAYNNYGNNRNAIERGRMDDLRSLLGNYQGTLGDIENAYLAGMSDADSDYSGSIADAMTNYYDKKASLEAQNIANQYKASLGKSGTLKVEDPYKDVLSVGRSYKGNAAGYKKYMDALGIPEQDQRMLQMQVGNDPDSMNILPVATRNAILDELDTVPEGMRSNPPVMMQYVNNLMQRLVKQYNLTEDQARELLEEAGY